MSPSGYEAIEQLDPTTDDEVTAADLLTVYTELGRRITSCTTSGAAFTALTAAAVDTVPGVDHASITRRRDGRFQTLAPTDAVATAADSLQYELDDGPCVDAVRDGGPLNGDDLAHDARWPEYGPRVAAELGVASTVSLSLVLDDDLAASLNLYSDRVRGFSARSTVLAVILATYGALYVGVVVARERAHNLETALINSRRIGMAVGVLMTARKLRDRDAFDLMRTASQNTNRRMVLVAEEIIETGTIEAGTDRGEPVVAVGSFVVEDGSRFDLSRGESLRDVVDRHVVVEGVATQHRSDLGGRQLGDGQEQPDRDPEVGPRTHRVAAQQDREPYSRKEIERVTRLAAYLALAKDPPCKVWSLDKANVLATSRLWRRVVTETMEKEFPKLELGHHLIDSAAMLMVKDPRALNGVIVTSNLFGDIISDEASVIPGSLGLLPSASLSGVPDGKGLCNGIYEPIHGSAPDIAGKGLINPVAAILSVAMLLLYSLNMPKESTQVELAVQKVIEDGVCTKDIGGTSSTTEVGDAVAKELETLMQ